MAEKYTLTKSAVRWLVDKLKGSAQKQDVLTLEEIQASTDLSGKIASASALKNIKDNVKNIKIIKGTDLDTVTFTQEYAGRYLVLDGHPYFDVACIYILTSWSDGALRAEKIGGNGTLTFTQNERVVTVNGGHMLTVIYLGGFHD